MAVCKERDTKAELNHRGQICEVLIDTGISHRGKKNPKRTESDVRPLLRPCGVSAGTAGSIGEKEMVEHQGIAPCIAVWKTGVCLSTPMPGKLESRARVALAWVVLQTTAWAVRPTGCEIEVRTETFASARID